MMASSSSSVHCADLEDFIRESRLKGRAYVEISESLRTLYPGERGFSARTLRQYCMEGGIHRTTRLPSTGLNRVVATAVSQVRTWVQTSESNPIFRPRAWLL